MKVQNKTIVVTGGGSGMGRELVLNLLLKGAKVVAVDINEAGLKETVVVSGKSASSLTPVVTDITSKDSVNLLFENVISKFGSVDGIINNAGIIQPFVRIKDLDYDLIERVINVNLYGTLYMVKAFLPHLLTRPEAHIVNISSMGGFLPVPGQTIYGASKAAVKLLTEGLHAELANTNVKVTVVFPGAVNTGILKNSGLKLPETASGQNSAPKILSPAKAAQIIVKAMEENKYRVLVGKDARLMDFFYRLNPKRASRMIGKQMDGLLSGHP